MNLSFGIKDDQQLYRHDGVELWQVGLNRVEDVVQAAYGVYEDVIARKYNFPFHSYLVEDAIELYKRWHRNSVLLAYQTNEGEIIASSCLTRKVSSISLQIDKDYKDFIKQYTPETDYQSIYYGSLTFVNKKALERSNLNKAVSFAMYRQMNLLLGDIVAQDEKPAYLGDFEQTAFLLINRALGMRWEAIGEATPWLGSLNIPACHPICNLKNWLIRNQKYLSLPHAS